MSEPQFSYSNLTLDELRSMAASPQVGSIQAMPQSFHALADRVGEVADLLSHAQADLPNWWKGPAAERAAATLGRAAAEAREFHDSARGAASTVSRCAQVVAEQQHQMINVPHVPEPGITDVVQRPTTPLEALNAARQDATYQAAHEQAVQVVNGIAAQYVETRTHLDAIGHLRGENFATPAKPLDPAQSPTSPIDQPSTDQPSTAATSHPIRNKAQSYAREVPHNSAIRSDSVSRVATHYEIFTGGGLSSAPSPSEHGQSINSKSTKSARPISESPSPDFANSTRPSDKVTRREPELHASRDIAFESEDRGPEALAIALRAAPEQKRPRASTSMQTSYSSIEETPHRTPPPTAYGAVSPPSEEANVSLPQIVRTKSPDDMNSNAGMIPPYTGFGSAGHGREKRKSRPSYLKERKSEWVPEIIAVPADGVIAPDSFM